jgi:predicted helicase
VVSLLRIPWSICSGLRWSSSSDSPTGLQKNINPNISERDAIEMLSQHLITAPVFEALFEGYSFVKNNPISKAMQSMLELLEEQALEKDTQSLEKFYASVRKRAEGIDNSEGKQRIILELYEKYFKTALPKMVDRLGIVYTPVEVVDFIVHSVNDVLKKEFDRTIGDENIHILDPFTGTGTFVTRLIQSGLIDRKNLAHKYQNEIHANEIVLLAYYIAAVNIENAYHDAMDETDYSAFEGICLTDTFQLGESDDGEKLFSEMFPQNSARVQRQKKAPLRVIMGNPPYSVGQKSANDNSQNQKYEKLDGRISSTYASKTDATNKNSLYNSYIKAFRWSTDRLDKNGGIVCFVSDGGWLDNSAHEGFRKCLENEFTSIYVFNLKGNARSQGEQRKKEAGNVFGGGSRTPIAITLLVKNPISKNTKAEISYHEIADYLSREEKLGAIRKSKSLTNSNFSLSRIHPNEHGDWISQRNDSFNTFISIGEKSERISFFVPTLYCRGLETSRDAWAYNSSQAMLKSNVKRSLRFYNEQVDIWLKYKSKPNAKIEEAISFDDSMVSWSRAFLNEAKNGKRKKFSDDNIVQSLYRPFFKQNLYFSREFNNVVSRMDSFFPSNNSKNLLLCVSGTSASVSNCIPDLHFNGDTQCFPLYYYEERLKEGKTLFDSDSKEQFIRRDGISDTILTLAQTNYGKELTKEDIFYYVFGFLQSPTYKETFTNDLKKMLPRLPLVEDVRDFWAFSKAGRKLADLHINYENVEPHPTTHVVLPEIQYQMDAYEFYSVEKMRFPKKDQKDTILYNSRIRVETFQQKHTSML